MLNPQKRFLVPSLIAVLAVTAGLVACGGSDDSSASDLAGYIPADAPVYIEGMVQPEGDVAANADAIAEKLTGSTLSDTIGEALASSEKTEIDFEQDVEPWLGESAGIYVGAGLLGDLSATDFGSAAMSAAADPGSGESVAAVAEEGTFGLIAETTDVDATEAFLAKMAEGEGGTTDGEYEGFSYRTDDKDDSVTGIVDDHLVAADSVAGFEAMVDASKGDSLKDSDAWKDVADKIDDDSLVNVYLANDAFSSAEGDDGPDPNAVLKSLGLDVTGTASVISLVPGENEISIRGASDADSELESADPSALLETFPADSVLALGSGGVGDNAKEIIEAVNKDGIEGVLPPGELDQQLNELTEQGFDVKGLLENLDTVGLFVSGDSSRNLGGALVATSSDVGPLKSSLNAFSSLLALAGDADVKKLGGGMTGFRVAVDQIPGRPLVVAVGDDRLVLAVGMPAARQALKGEGSALSDSAVFKAANDSISGDGLHMFGDPSALGDLLAGVAGSDADTKDMIDALGKFEYMAAGPGDSDGSFELNLGLKD